MPLWTPSRISTALWLDAADSSTVTLVSSVVSQWNDKSGLGHTFSQTSAGKRPATSTLNSRNVIDFDGSDDVLTIGSNSIGRNASSLSLFWVMQTESINSDRRFFNSSHGTGGTNARVLQGFNSSSVWRIGGRREDAGSYQENVSVSASGDINTWRVMGFEYNYTAASLMIFRDGQQASTGAFLDAGNSSDTSSQTAFIGSAVGGTQLFYDGKIAEVIAVHSNVTSTNRQLIEGYLAHKWGLSGSLPNDHPYKNAAPSYGGSSPINGQSLIRPAGSAQQQLLIQGATT
jgi:hypothetical protein